MPPHSCCVPGKKSGHVLKGDQRNIERVAESHEPRALDRGIDVQHAGKKRGLIGDDADGRPIEPRETHDEIFREMLVDLEEIMFVGDGVDHILDVVGLHGIGGDERIERRIGAVGRIRGGAARRVVQIVRRKKTHQLADHGEAFGVVARDEMRDAAGGVVRHGAAQVLLGDVLVRDGLDDVRAGDEHVRRIARHENEIGDRGRVHGAARAGAHDGADLRDHAAGERVAQKNIGVTRQRHHAFLDARAARIIEADHRRAVAHRQVHDLADLEGVRFRERAAEHGEILREHVDQPAIDAAKAGDEAVAGRPLLLHPEIVAAVRDKFVEFLECAFVEQQRDALARREFAGLVLALAAFGAAAGFRFGAAPAQLLEGDLAWGIGHGSLVMALLPSRLSHRRERVCH